MRKEIEFSHVSSLSVSSISEGSLHEIQNTLKPSQSAGSSNRQSLNVSGVTHLERCCKMSSASFVRRASLYDEHTQLSVATVTLGLPSQGIF